MKIQDLKFDYPESLVARSPEYPPRVMWVQNSEPREISFFNLLERIRPEDVLVINETKVLKRRMFAKSLSKPTNNEIEFLFLGSREPQLNPAKPHLPATQEWEVLFPAKLFRLGDEFELPGGIRIELIEKGRPQWVRSTAVLDESYFQKYAEVPLPPYIQKARDQRHTQIEDDSWYQTAWAQNPGSLAAPTASLHFRESDLQILKDKGVHIAKVTLHVGLGTFLPVQTPDLDDHQMHSEWVEVPAATWRQIHESRRAGRTIWSLGTTVARSLESAALGKLTEGPSGFSGMTDLLIQPGFQWQVCDRLLTNFHQPESTLLALVAGFSDLKTVHHCYRWAIQNEFRLFSYGDLSVWA